MQSPSKSTPWPPGGSKSEKGKGNSFSATIAALKLQGESTEVTVTEAAEIVGKLDELVQRIQDEGERGDCLKVLADICRRHVILPKSCMISDVKLGKQRESGRAANIWAGELRQEDVCVKVFRQHSAEDGRKTKGDLYHLAVLWKNISHPNVLSFLGVHESRALPSFGLVTPLMSSNIKDYTRDRQDDDRLLLLADAASGLKHLHLLGIVHGGVNPGNVLVTPQGRACVGDFGFAEIIDVALQSGSPSRTHGGIRYMAPEQLDESVTGKESDVYSFAITAYEVLVGIKPYPAVTGGGPLTKQITRGARPLRPDNEAATRWLSDDVWKMLESCWTPKPSSRPTIEEVHQVFQRSNTTMNNPTSRSKFQGTAPPNPSQAGIVQVERAQVGTTQAGIVQTEMTQEGTSQPEMAQAGIAQGETEPQLKGKFVDWFLGLSCFHNKDLERDDLKQ